MALVGLVCSRVARVSAIDFLVTEVVGARGGARTREGDNAANLGWDVECLRSSETSEERYKGGDLVLQDE